LQEALHIPAESSYPLEQRAHFEDELQVRQFAISQIMVHYLLLALIEYPAAQISQLNVSMHCMQFATLQRGTQVEKSDERENPR